MSKNADMIPAAVGGLLGIGLVALACLIADGPIWAPVAALLPVATSVGGIWVGRRRARRSDG